MRHFAEQGTFNSKLLELWTIALDPNENIDILKLKPKPDLDIAALQDIGMSSLSCNVAIAGPCPGFSSKTCLK